MRRRPRRATHRPAIDAADQEAADRVFGDEVADTLASLAAVDNCAASPDDLIAAVIDDMAEMPLPERAVLCDQLARLHAGTNGSRAAHIAKGWRALTMMFMLQALHRRDGGSFSLHFRQSLLAECATLRRRAGTHFLRGGARLATDVLPN